MINLFLNASFYLMVLFLIIGIYYNYRVQYLMFRKIRPILRQHGSNFMAGIVVLRYKKDLLLYEEICNKSKIKSDLPTVIKKCDKKSWLFLIISFLFLIGGLLINKIVTG